MRSTNVLKSALALAVSSLVFIASHAGAAVPPKAPDVPAEVAAQIERMFGNEDVAYIHLHNAKRGCFSCRVERV